MRGSNSMARRAEVILDITPDLAGLKVFEREAMATAQRIRTALNQAAGGVGGGSGGGRGGSGGSGGGSGGSSGGGLTPDEKAILRAQKRIVDQQARSKIDQTLAVDKAQEQATKNELDRIYKVHRQQMSTAQHARAAQAQQAAADRALRTQQKQAAREAAAEQQMLGRLRMQNADVVGRIELQRQRDLGRARSDSARAEVNAHYDQRAAAARGVVSNAQGQGFWASFQGGWNKAGGLGSAVGTVLKYGAAYKMVEVGSRLAMAPVTALSMAVKEGWAAWVDYEEAMANASRTMQQPGMKTELIKSVMGRDALQFISDYRVKLQDVATAQYELGSANFTAAQTMQTYQVPLKVNIALMGDITQTTRLMTQMLKIHSKQMGDTISDHDKMVKIGAIITKTWQIEQMELSDLSAAYKYVAGNAGALNMKVEELIPLIGFLSTTGLRGSIGGTGLNQFLTQLSRTLTTTKDGFAQLRKETQKGTQVVDLGIKVGDLKNPTQIMTAIAKAMSGGEMSFASKLKTAGALSDIFNVRGARPMLIMLQQYGEVLKRIGDVSRLTVAEQEKMIEQFVELRQQTPTGAMELLQNQIYATGTQFMLAAVGASTFVEAINAIRKGIKDATPEIEGFGRSASAFVKGQAAGWSYLLGEDQNRMEALPGFGWIPKFLNAREAGQNAAGQSVREGYGAKAKEQAGKWWLEQTGTDAEKRAAFAMWQDREVRRIQTAETARVNSQIRKMWPGADISTPELRRAWKAKLKIKDSDEASYQSAAIGALKLSDVINTAEQQKVDPFNPFAKMADQFNAAKAGYHLEPKGGKGKGSKKADDEAFRRNLENETADIEKFKDAADWAATQLQLLGVEQERLNRLLQAGVITEDLMSQTRKKSTYEVNLHRENVAALRGEFGAYVVEQMRLEGLRSSAKTPEQKKSVEDKIKQAKQAQRALQVQIAQGEEAQNVAAAKPLQDAYRRMAQLTQVRLDLDERAGKTREQTLKRLAVQVQLANQNEDLFGQTVDSVRVKIDALTSSTEGLASAREKEEARFVEFGRKYEAVVAITDKLRNGQDLSADDQTYAQGLLGFSDEELALSIKQRTLYDALISQQKTYQSEKEASRSAVQQYTDSIREESTALVEYQRLLGSLPIANALEDLGRETETTQAVFDALGRNWDLSGARANALSRELDLLTAQMADYWRQYDLFMTSGGTMGMSPDQVERGLAEAEAKAARLRAQRDLGMRRGIDQTKEDYAEKIRQTQSGWMRGAPRQMARAQIRDAEAALDIEMKRLREQFGDEPWAKDMLASYEAVMRKDAIMKPWLEARDQIVSDWGNAFQKLFTDLIAGGDSPFKAAFESIIGSIQVQIIQGAVEKYLGGMFDQFATIKTGIDPTAAANATAQSMNVLSSQSVSLTNSFFNLNAVLPSVVNGLTQLVKPGDSGPFGSHGEVFKSLMGSFSGGSSLALGFGGRKNKVKWGKGVEEIAETAISQILQGYSYGQLSGSLAGKDPGSAGTAGAIGALVGSFIPGVGTVVGGLIGGLFGKKKKAAPAPQQDPQASKYGMPAMVYESYLYGLYESEKNLTGYTLGSNSGTRLTTNSVGKIEINVNGGDTEKVRKVINEALRANFGTYAVSMAGQGAMAP